MEIIRFQPFCYCQDVGTCQRLQRSIHGLHLGRRCGQFAQPTAEQLSKATFNGPCCSTARSSRADRRDYSDLIALLDHESLVSVLVFIHIDVF